MLDILISIKVSYDRLVVTVQHLRVCYTIMLDMLIYMGNTILKKSSSLRSYKSERKCCKQLYRLHENITYARAL